MDQTDMSQSAGGVPRRSQLQGPCYLKMLVNNMVAGSIIGKNGAVIASIENNSGAVLKLSSPNVHFPGTQERIVAMSGSQEQLNNAILIILEKIREVAGTVQQPEMSEVDMLDMQGGAGRLLTKLALPKSSVSAIIGKGGQQIKELQETTGAKIQISSREEGLNERTVTIQGAFESVQNATLTIAASVQTDPNLKDHMYLNYSRPGMMGGGFGGQMGLGGGFSAGGATGGMSIGQNSGFGPLGQGAMGDFNPRCEVVVFIADDAVGTVIGKGGAVLNEIQSQSGARVQISSKGDLIPGTTERKCTILGPMSCVHAAHYLLLQRLEQHQSKMMQGGAGAAGAMAQNGGMQGHPMAGGAGTPQMMAGGMGAVQGMGVPQQQQLYNPHMMQQPGGGYMQGY